MNISAKTLYKTGSTSMMVIGIGHLVTHFVMKGKNPAMAAIISQMGESKISLMGTSRSIQELKEGFSITMGVLLVFMGLQNLFISGKLNVLFENNKGVMLVPILLSVIVFFLSLNYFFRAPQVFSFIALVSYTLSFWKLTKEVK